MTNRRVAFSVMALVAGLFLAANVLSGCAVKTTATLPDGTILETRAGFGNRTTFGPVTVEPAANAVAAGERLGVMVLSKASDALIGKMVDAATSNSAVQ